MSAPTPQFTKEEVETLLAIADTVFPAVTPEELVKLHPAMAQDLDAETIAAFAKETPSTTPAFIQVLTEDLPGVLPPAKFAELKQVLGLFRSRIGMLALSSGFTLFHELPVPAREQLLLSWKTARLPIFRKIYDSLVKLNVSLYIRSSQQAQKAMLYNPIAVEPASDLFKFSFSSVDQVKDIKFDAIIVGSGSGGGVVAKELSEAGLKILVIEKGNHYDLNGPALSESEALKKMYAGGAYTTNDYGDVAIVSAATFGGGSAVNWAAALQPPHSVRQDWASTFKLPYFTSTAFQDDLDAVCQYMGVSAPTSQNIQNKILLEGARRNGFLHAAVPQNNGGVAHNCNHDCANGCRSGGKKGGVHSWLIDAARSGATFVTDVDVRRIVLSKDNQAEGVLVRDAGGKETVIKAPRVFVCGGSIESPALLLRSKIRNARVGQSLYLHPTNYVYGVFPQRTYPTDGQILTSVVGEYANLSPSGHGVRVETGIMQPVVASTLIQWEGGAEAKARIAKHPHMVGCIAIARDRSPGRVRIDGDGQPVVDYTVSAFDTNSILQGSVLAAKCLVTMGAEEIIVAGRGTKPWKKGDDFEAWTKLVEASSPGCYGTAHQMGSNRMSSSPAVGVCDPTGAVWGVKGVYVADASVLPSATGVNPMICTMAIARKVVKEALLDITLKNPAAPVAARL